MNPKKKALGRGLSALLENATEFQQSTFALGSIFKINISLIEANPYQPRNIFEEDALNDLARSIEKVGIIQPITVCKKDDEFFSLISGERRFRAAKLAGLTEIPAYVRGADSNEEMLQMALIENIQREDLNAIELAHSFQRFIDEFSLTQEELSEKVGKKRSTVTNYLRLLRLPAEIQVALRDNVLSMGHCRALISLKSEAQQLRILNKIIAKGLSVRQVEQIVKDLNEKENTHPKQKPIKKNYTQIKKELSTKLGMPVQVKKDSKGFVSVLLKCQDDNKFQDIIRLLNQ